MACLLDDVNDSDVGSASLTIVLLAPALLVLMFAGFQAALWNHTRTEARVVAREAAVLVARDHVSSQQASAAATATLARDSLLSDARVSVRSTSADVVVTITGNAPGVLRGTLAAVRVSVALPVEGWVGL